MNNVYLEQDMSVDYNNLSLKLNAIIYFCFVFLILPMVLPDNICLITINS